MDIAINPLHTPQSASDHIYKASLSADNLPTANTSDIDAAATQFSALLINTMIDSMRKTLNNEGSTNTGGLQYDFFNDLLFQQYSEIIAESDVLGLNQFVKESLSR